MSNGAGEHSGWLAHRMPERLGKAWLMVDDRYDDRSVVHTVMTAREQRQHEQGCGRRDSNPHCPGQGDFKSSSRPMFPIAVPTGSRFVAMPHINDLPEMS
ncbi:MAG: hypothetical protein ACRYFW_04070, partial [Janthinobacterium lividum]